MNRMGKVPAGLRLIRPCGEYLDSYKEAVKEERRLRPDQEESFSDPDIVLQKAADYENGRNLKPGYVRMTMLWLVRDDRFIGEVGIRHELTPALTQYAGHIGYGIRPSEEGKGYGTIQLAMALQFCREELHLTRVLITCDDDNQASARVIEKNGGVLENKVINELDRGAVLTRRYWISL